LNAGRSRFGASVGIGVLLVCGAACRGSDDTAAPMVRVVALEAQGCDRPQRRFGQATLLDGHTALTAGHLVEGPLRMLELDGEPASVVAFDERLDVAVISTARGAQAWSDENADAIGDSYVDGPVDIVLADDAIATRVVRAVALRVDDATDRTVYDRPSLELDIVVEEGHSGAPVIDDAGRIVGVVTLRRRSAGVSYATRFDALDQLLSSTTTALSSAGDGLAVDPPCT
jgi:S1-C subfamily serine protease